MFNLCKNKYLFELFAPLLLGWLGPSLGIMDEAPYPVILG